MAAIVINGNAIAAAIRREWKGRTEALKRRGVLPALAVVIVGDNLASKIYVRNKVKACCEVGLHCEVHELPNDIGEDLVVAHIRRLNHNPYIHGILVQLPLPPQLNRDKLLATVSADKDADGLDYRGQARFVYDIFGSCPRRPRVDLDRIPLHIVQRGHNREPCFFGEEDYDTYLHGSVRH